MRRPAPASPPRRPLPLRVLELEARDVPAAFNTQYPGEQAWIDNQFRQLRNGDTFRNEWVVQLGAGQNGAALANSLGAVQTDVIQSIGGIEWQFVSGADSQAQVAALTGAQDQGKIGNFYPVIYHNYQKEFIPNDAYYPLQWNLNNTGQTGGKAGIDANLEEAWDIFADAAKTQRIDGSGVVIKIIDDGVQYLHPDLRGNLFINPRDPGDPYRATDIKGDALDADGLDNDNDGFVDNFMGWDFIDDDNNPEPDISSDFHGTAVAGIATAKGENGIGVTGTAFRAKYIPIRVIGGVPSDQDISDALLMLNGHTGVINNSWGIPDTHLDIEAGRFGPLLAQAIREAAVGGRGGKGSVLVFSAGNQGDIGGNTNYRETGNSPYVISVGALDHNGERAFYSNPGASLFISVPAGPAGPNDINTTLGVTTTDLFDADGYNDGAVFGDSTYTNDFIGTSGAAPLVSGVIALMLQANPNLTYRDVQAILVETASQANSRAYNINGAEYAYSEDFGFGMIDAAAAVNLAKTWVNLAPQVNVSEEVAVNTRLEDAENDPRFDDFDPNPPNDPDGDPTVELHPVTETVEFFSNVKIEWMTLKFNATAPFRGDYRIVLTSPSGAQVTLASPRADLNPDYDEWTFSSPFFWGELARGKWTVSVVDESPSKVGGLAINDGSWDDFTLSFFGTEIPPDQAPPLPPPVITPTLPPIIPGLGTFDPGDSGQLENVFPRTPAIVVSVPFSGVVQAIDPANGQARFSVVPFGPNYHGTISVAQGDVTGDGIQDVIVGAGPGAGPHVKVFDGATGNEIASFFAYDASFTGGVNVAAGDVNADGRADIIAAAGPGGGPHIRTFNGNGFNDLGSFMAYDAGFRGGSSVAMGDVNGDGREDYIVGAGFGGGPHVYVIDGVSKAVISTFFAYDASFRNGVNVAAGDVTGDGLADVITGPGLGGGPDVRAFDIASGSKAVRGFFAYDPNVFNFGVNVTARDLNGDRVADIITAPETGSDPIREFNGVDSTLLAEVPTNSIVGVFVG